MPRQTIKNDVPEEWRRRYEAGICPVCAKLPEEFDKGQRVFCSKKCREEYASHYFSWNELKEKIFARDGRKCAKCKITEEIFEKKRKAERNKKLQEWIDNHKDDIDKKRDEMLVDLDKEFKERFDKIKDDKYVAERVLDYDEKRELLREYSFDIIQFDIDHIIPVALGGDMWDETNLQVLCEKHHKEKTKEDIKKINAKKKESINNS